MASLERNNISNERDIEEKENDHDINEDNVTIECEQEIKEEIVYEKCILKDGEKNDDDMHAIDPGNYQDKSDANFADETNPSNHDDKDEQNTYSMDDINNVDNQIEETNAENYHEMDDENDFNMVNNNEDERNYVNYDNIEEEDNKITDDVNGDISVEHESDNDVIKDMLCIDADASISWLQHAPPDESTGSSDETYLMVNARNVEESINEISIENNENGVTEELYIEETATDEKNVDDETNQNVISGEINVDDESNQNIVSHEETASDEMNIDDEQMIEETDIIEHGIKDLYGKDLISLLTKSHGEEREHIIDNLNDKQLGQWFKYKRNEQHNPNAPHTYPRQNPSLQQVLRGQRPSTSNTYDETQSQTLQHESQTSYLRQQPSISNTYDETRPQTLQHESQTSDLRQQQLSIDLLQPHRHEVRYGTPGAFDSTSPSQPQQQQQQHEQKEEIYIENSQISDNDDDLKLEELPNDEDFQMIGSLHPVDSDNDEDILLNLPLATDYGYSAVTPKLRYYKQDQAIFSAAIAPNDDEYNPWLTCNNQQCIEYCQSVFRDPKIEWFVKQNKIKAIRRIMPTNSNLFKFIPEDSDKIECIANGHRNSFFYVYIRNKGDIHQFCTDSKCGCTNVRVLQSNGSIKSKIAEGITECDVVQDFIGIFGHCFYYNKSNDKMYYKDGTKYFSSNLGYEILIAILRGKFIKIMKTIYLSNINSMKADVTRNLTKPEKQRLIDLMKQWKTYKFMIMKGKGIDSIIERIKAARLIQFAESDVAHKELVVCRDGIINLRTGKLVPWKPEYKLITNDRMLNMNYIAEEDLDPEIKKEVFELIKRFLPNPKTMQMVLEFLWIALSDHELKVLQYHFGAHSNGKSTFLESVNYLWGSYCQRCGEDLLSKNGKSNSTTGLANTEGKRLLHYDEFSKTISGTQLKTFVGTALISARKIYCDTKCFKNKSKTMMASNIFPIFDFLDMALKSRIQFIPWIAFFCDPNVAGHPRNPDPKKHQHPVNSYYKTETWFEKMGPYFFHLIVHYGKRVINRMENGLSICPIPSNESRMLHEEVFKGCATTMKGMILFWHRYYQRDETYNKVLHLAGVFDHFNLTRFKHHTDKQYRDASPTQQKRLFFGVIKNEIEPIDFIGNIRQSKRRMIDPNIPEQQSKQNLQCITNCIRNWRPTDANCREITDRNVREISNELAADYKQQEEKQIQNLPDAQELVEDEIYKQVSNVDTANNISANNTLTFWDQRFRNAMHGEQENDVGLINFDSFDVQRSVMNSNRDFSHGQYVNNQSSAKPPQHAASRDRQQMVLRTHPTINNSGPESGRQV